MSTWGDPYATKVKQENIRFHKARTGTLVWAGLGQPAVFMCMATVRTALELSVHGSGIAD